MIHHERLRPPSRDYPADEWNVIEKRFHPEFLAQLETMLALGNGYLGMRGCPEEGGPNAEISIAECQHRFQLGQKFRMKAFFDNLPLVDWEIVEWRDRKSVV